MGNLSGSNLAINVVAAIAAKIKHICGVHVVDVGCAAFTPDGGTQRPGAGISIRLRIGGKITLLYVPAVLGLLHVGGSDDCYSGGGARGGK